MSENKESSPISRARAMSTSPRKPSAPWRRAAVEVDGVAGLSNLGNDIAGIAGKKNPLPGHPAAQRGGRPGDRPVPAGEVRHQHPGGGQSVQEAVMTSVESVIGLKVSAVQCPCGRRDL